MAANEPKQRFGESSKFERVTEHTIERLVDEFYRKVRLDPALAPIFARAIASDDWGPHLAVMRNFWSSVMLTTGRYKGNPMAAHMKLPIQPHFFARWLALWQETAGEVFAPEPAAAFRDKANRIAESLKLALFYRPGALPIARGRGAQS